MFRDTLAQIKTISSILADPLRAERAMHARLMSCIKLCKRVLTRNLLSVLHKHKVGTNDVNRCMKVLCIDNRNKKRKQKILCYLMKDKLEDAEKEVRKAKAENLKRINEYKKEVREGERADSLFKDILKKESQKAWNIGKTKKTRKVDHLLRKTANERTGNRTGKEEDMKGIKYKDQDLERLNEDRDQEAYMNKPRVYGGVEVDSGMTAFLSKDPGFMMFDKIDALDVEVEIEKGITKTRYELMNRGEEDDEEECENDQGRRNTRQDEPNKVLNYCNLRATDIPTVPRLIEPAKATLQQEIVMENTKQKLLDTLHLYMNNNCDKKGNIKDHNLNSTENKQLQRIKKDIKEKKLVVFTTDKSGKFSVDSPTNYEKAVTKHTEKDMEIKEEGKVKQIENKMNQHMRQFNKMFQVGKNNEHEQRVMAATISSNTPAPPMYGLRKDHKHTENEIEGPPVRPVCGANEAPNSRLSHFLSRVLNDYCNVAEIETECRSGEEMKAAFEKYNKEEGVESKKKCKVISMDVKALYPSMEWDEIDKAVRELIETSEREIEGVDWYETGKYLAVEMTEEEIKKEKLKTALPKRKGNAKRKVTVAYLSNKQNDDKWTPATKDPSPMQRKRMLAIAISKGIRACMENHVYKVGDRTFLQKSGGPIGLELTGAASRAFMRRWDRMYLEKAKQAGIAMKVYERYVDDSNQVAEVPPLGARYDRQRERIVIEENHEEEEQKEDDERLAEILKEIANSIMPCIQMEADWPSKNQDGKLPILDLKVWTNKEGSILYTHYEKPMANKNILHNKSAHTGTCKRSVHTQEVLRRLMNCSRELDWSEEVAPVATEYMYRMKMAGYKEEYRKSIAQSALKIFKLKQDEDREGIRPMFRPRDWKKEERDKAKKNKRKEWATKKGHSAPIFVPATPGGKLAKAMKEVADKEAAKGIHFNIVEMGGRRLKTELQKSNPTAKPGCTKADCMPCKDERGKGGKCHKANINYIIECMLCPPDKRSSYIGETSRNLYTRALEHQNSKEDEGFMNKHMKECHPGEERNFVARVTHTNKDCLTRQIREGSLISNSKVPLLNTKSEWFQPPLFKIQSEIVRI